MGTAYDAAYPGNFTNIPHPAETEDFVPPFPPPERILDEVHQQEGGEPGVVDNLDFVIGPVGQLWDMHDFQGNSIVVRRRAEVIAGSVGRDAYSAQLASALAQSGVTTPSEQAIIAGILAGSN